jgi:hypothetical protein
MVSMHPPTSLAQRTGLALAEALRQSRPSQPLLADGRIRRASDLLIDGVQHDQLPDSLDRTRLKSPHSATALAINSFLPWQSALDQLPLNGVEGFEAIQFEVRCPTGLRGTPPHLDLLALRVDSAVAVIVRCTEYLSRRRSPLAASYDRLLATTLGLGPWLTQLEQLRTAREGPRHVDVGALIKHALALGRTFPDRPSTLLYLFWEPLDAEQFEEFRRHRQELERLVDAVHEARVRFVAQSFAALWQDWGERPSPLWLRAHVERLRARYSVSLAGARR